MHITWLGQAGLLFETDQTSVIIDPYLSNSVASVQPQNYRKVPVDEKFLSIKPSVIIITHSHLDHFDKETLKNYLNDNSEVTVLSPSSVWSEIRQFGGNKNNYVLFNNGTVWSENGFEYRAVKAEHSDEYSIGVIINFNGKNYYVTGDTLYNEKVLLSLPKVRFEAVFLPINGKGNNMNAADAVKFATRLRAKYVVPIHFGLFDSLTGKELLLNNKIIPTVYKEIELI